MSERLRTALRSPSRVTRALALAGVLAPPGFLAWLLAGAYVELPYLDQWELLKFFYLVGTGEVRLPDLVARHFDQIHHVFIPRWILTALAFATDWTIKYEVALIFLSAALTCWLLLRMTAMRAATDGWGAVCLASVLTSVLVFSLAQLLTFFWGWAFIIILPNLCLALAVYRLRPERPGRWQRKVAAAGLYCLVATFSIAHGPLAWFAVLPSVVGLALASGRRRAVVGTWLGMATFVWTLFLWGYDPTVDTLDAKLDKVSTGPVVAIGYYLRLLGAPLGFTTTLLGAQSLDYFAPIGLAVLSVFLVSAVALLIVGDAARRSQVVPWVSVGLFSVLYAGMNTVGRATPVTSVLFFLSASMYATPTTPLTIAAFQLGLMALVELRRRFPATSVHVSVPAFGLGVLALIAALGFVLGIPGALAFRDTLALSEPCFDVFHYTEPQTMCSPLHTHADGVQRLEALGFRHTPRDLVFVRDPAAVAGEIEGFELTGSGPPKARIVQVRGRLSEEAAQGCHGVLFERAGTERFIAYARVDDDRRWIARIQARHVLRGPAALRAWAYDRAGGRFLPLAGEVSPGNLSP
jgi:hypothetical protein